MISSRIALGIALAAIEVCARALSQEQPRHLPLEEASWIALRNHPAIVRAGRLTAAARERIRQARAGMMPNASLQAAATDGPAGAPAFGLQGIVGDPLKKHYGSGLNVTQTLFDFGRTDHLVAARKLLTDAAEEDEDTQRALILL